MQKKSIYLKEKEKRGKKKEHLPLYMGCQATSCKSGPAARPQIVPRQPKQRAQPHGCAGQHQSSLQRAFPSLIPPIGIPIPRIAGSFPPLFFHAEVEKGAGDLGAKRCWCWQSVW